MKAITSIVCTFVCLGVMNLHANDSVKTDSLHETLSHVPAAELPVKVVGMIKQTKSAGRETMTVKVVKSALDLNPASAPALVGAIARAFPELASLAAGTAAAQQPKQAAVIARAAAAAAPAKAGKIVAAVCRVVPGDFRNIALIVAEVVPGAGVEILNGIGAAIPNLKASIMQTLAASQGNAISVAQVLAQVNVSTSAPANTTAADSAAPVQITRSARGPAVGPPYIPLSGTPGNVNPGNSGEVPTGGRGYAAP